ncbi:MAG: hypothetical protein QXZ41_06090 [Ignisphaera sp.]|uniref:Uncharacterized protein n=1 Tax=Ignisphaera aggregans TaxID=334771 RepID=A0A7C4NMX0_9CREN
MRLKFWVIAVIISVVTSFSVIALRYSVLDFIATALLLLVSTYVTLRFILSIYFGIEMKPVLYIDFKYLNSAVFNGVVVTMLGITLDAILSMVYTRTVQSMVLSAVITLAVLHIINKILGLKGLKVVLTLSVLITGVLYVLGYIKEIGLAPT